MAMWMFLIALQLCAGNSMWAAGAGASRPPIIMVPGLPESDLVVNSSCSGGWKLFWPITKDTFDSGAAAQCWFRELPVLFDNATKTFGNVPGVTVDVIGFGRWIGLNYFLRAQEGYIQAGWIPEVTLFAAPFDWRYSSQGSDLFYSRLKELVERIYEQEKQKVVLLAVSYGPQLALSFLHRMSQSWKDTYIAWFVAESPVWSGTPLSLMAVSQGAYSGQEIFHILANIVSSGYWLFPREGNTNTTYGPSEILVQTPSKNYSSANYHELLVDVGRAERLDEFIALRTEPDLAQFAAPMVNTVVTYGFGLDTAGHFIYSRDFDGSPLQNQDLPKVINATETGDSIVPVRSSLRSTAWEADHAAAGLKMYHWAYANQSHANCNVKDLAENCFEDVVNLLVNGTRGDDEAAVEHGRVFKTLLGLGLL